jgi:MFS family permease
MSAPRRGSLLAPFRVRSFRFQWPSDLATSWAFEMETLILGWYIFVETQSVFLLTLFGSLLWIGTLIAPVFGMLGDRLGHRDVLRAMRAFYACLALVMVGLAFTGALAPVYVLVISTLMSMVRSSDLVMRYALVGQTIPAEHLMGAMGIERATSDSARVAGALSGAGLIAALGMGPAYVVIASFYIVSFLLTFGITRRHVPGAPAAGQASKRESPWQELWAAFVYVRSMPLLVATMWLAFLVNLTAYPFTLGLLPYVVKDILREDQTALGYLMASFALGALLASLSVSRFGSAIRAGRWMLVSSGLWHASLIVFAYATNLTSAVTVLFFTGAVQSLCLVPMAAILLRHSDERYRGRVVGVRMFAIYGFPVGLLAAGPIITQFGFLALTFLYCLAGIAFTGLIAWYWRAHVWRRNAIANRRT